MDNNNKLKLVTCNVNGLSQLDKQQSVFFTLESLQSDFLFLQETHGCDFKDWKGRVYCNPGTQRSCGVATLVASESKFEDVNIKKDANGRIIVVSGKLNGVGIDFVNVYAPTKPCERIHFFKDILPLFLNFRNQTVLVGDFNCVGSLYEDTLNHHPLSRVGDGHKELVTILEHFTVEDKWRVGNHSVREFTWYNRSGTQASRLDRVYAPASWKCEVTHVTFPQSDHKAVVSQLIVGGDKSKGAGKSYWKLNTAVLEESEYRLGIREVIEGAVSLKPLYDEIGEWWDSMKERVKRATIVYCQKRARDNNQCREGLVKTIVELETGLAQEGLSQEQS